jgi:hypothetical protein
MNDVFPEICSAALGEATPGSIALIPNHDGPLLALIVDESANEHLRSIVILNLKHQGSPSVVFHDNWGSRDFCLYYRTPLRFELSNKEGDVDTAARWWRSSGVIVSFKDEFFIQTAAATRSGVHYINIKSGALFSEERPNRFATFGVWSIWLRDPFRERSAQLFEFNIHKSQL